MVEVPVSFHYDAVEDIFSVWVRQPTDVLSTEIREGIVIRTDASTDEFVGFTVVDLKAQFVGMASSDATIPLVPEYCLRPLRLQLQAMEPALTNVA